MSTQLSAPDLGLVGAGTIMAWWAIRGRRGATELARSWATGINPRVALFVRPAVALACFGVALTRAPLGPLGVLVGLALAWVGVLLILIFVAGRVPYPKWMAPDWAVPRLAAIGDGPWGTMSQWAGNQSLAPCDSLPPDWRPWAVELETRLRELRNGGTLDMRIAGESSDADLPYLRFRRHQRGICVDLPGSTAWGGPSHLTRMHDQLLHEHAWQRPAERRGAPDVTLDYRIDALAEPGFEQALARRAVLGLSLVGADPKQPWVIREASHA